MDANGASHAGELESTNRSGALELLQRRGLTPLALNDASTLAVAPSFLEQVRQLWPASDRTALSTKQLVSLTQSLAALLRAGLTIDRALSITAGLEKHPQTRTVLAELGKSVRAGRTFADALIESKLRLPPYYVGMVQAGEVGGSLAQTLSRLAELLRKQHEIRERIRSALIYPSLLGCVVLLTIVLLLTFVLPRFQTLFAESEAPLPWATRAVLAIGGFVSSFWWLLAILVAAGIAAVLSALKTPRGREWLDAWLLRSRLTLGLPAAIDTARLLRTLSTLLANGVQIGSAMRIARATLSNTRLRKGLDEAAQRIKAGQSTSAALNAVAVFPAHAIQLARVGEETGRLEELLLEAATILEGESNTALERLLTLLVPALTVGMGLMIAGLIGSVLVGLLSVNDLAF
ncbi:MAG TPA: type II secretion system F family protein [Steroidobacteraceae bacterium]